MERRILTAVLLLFALEMASSDHINTLSDHDHNDTTDAQNDNVDTCNGFNSVNLLEKLTDHDVEESLSLPSTIGRECYCDYSPTTQMSSLMYRASKCPIQCFRCSTVYPKCQIQNVCCPDPEANYTTSSYVEFYDDRSVCVELVRGKEFLLHRSCPDEYDDDLTRALCEEELPAENTTRGTILAMTDERTRVTYYNKYCAKCNNVQQVQPWQLEIQCDTNLYMAGALTQDQFIGMSVKGGYRGCWIRQHPPVADAFQCHSRFLDREAVVINTCNVTGQEMYKTGVEDKCFDTPDNPGRRVIHGKHVYKNIYCLICNSEVTKSQTRRDCMRNVGVDRAPFRFFFGLDETGFQEKYDDSKDNAGGLCHSNEWMDPQATCRPVVCAEGKIFKTNVCETALSQYIVGLPYQMGLLLVPENGTSEYGDIDIEDVSSSVMTKIKDILTSAVHTIEFHTSVLYDRKFVNSSSDIGKDRNSSKNNDHQLSTIIRSVWVKIYFRGNMIQSRDFVERTVINSFNESFILVPINGSRFASFDVYFTHKSTFNFDSPCKGFPNTSCHTAVDVFTTNRQQVLERTPKLIALKIVQKPMFLRMHAYLTCPFVELSSEEVEETIDFVPVPYVTKLILRFRNFIFELTDPNELNRVSRGENGSFYVCQELLESITSGESLYHQDMDVFNAIEYVLTILCVSASLLCLSATVVTYCLFSNLRNVAGCNTMGLSLSLMVAQILLFVANAIQGPSNLCTAIGVITHYAWLVMFSWMFLCCLHVLRVFAGLRSRPVNGNNTHHDRNTIRFNLMTSLLVPAFIVLVVMGTYFTMYDGERLGYGYKTCAMDSPFAIHGPLIFVITCNAIFFFVVVFKIWGVRRLQGNMEIRKEDRKDFVVYMKLSTLTGMFWLLVILGEVFYNDIIRSFAVILNGCQGVFLFASFIANGRVLKHYQDKFKPKPN